MRIFTVAPFRNTGSGFKKIVFKQPWGGTVYYTLPFSKI
ncbi:MAG: hypothetical protein KatS3mg069_0152 [Meiothermus sp.]|nr:MAG: hypothetical protein KatS3mg069_0152 [Meiothermus sp.]